MNAVIFDLDNCLGPADEAGVYLYDRPFAAIRQANDGSVSDERLAAAFAAVWHHAFDWVARTYRFTPAMLEAGLREFARLEVSESLVGYGDLHLLDAVPSARFLVTSGFRRLQESKICALGIASKFTEIHIDAIDEPRRKGKRVLFEDIIAAHGLSGGDVLIVGDNPESEIEAGNSLGLRTVQTLRPNVTPSAKAKHHVADLNELLLLIRELQTGKQAGSDSAT